MFLTILKWDKDRIFPSDIGKLPERADIHIQRAFGRDFLVSGAGAFLSLEKPAGRFWCPDLSLGLHPCAPNTCPRQPAYNQLPLWGKSIQQPAGVAAPQRRLGSDRQPTLMPDHHIYKKYASLAYLHFLLISAKVWLGSLLDQKALEIQSFSSVPLFHNSMTCKNTW